MYESFAEYYDELMNVDYDQWINSVTKFLTGKKGVDLACGTGKFTIGLTEKGYDTVGVDISAEMLTKASENALRHGVKVEFVNRNMLDFIPFGKQDFCLCMCDGINYISAPNRLFATVASYLKTGGVFIFDISTRYRLKNELSGNTFSETSNDITYIWHNNLIAGRKLVSDLTIFAPDGNGHFIKKEESQTMFIHDEEKLVSDLKAAGFTVSLYGETLSSKKKATSQRIHFVCKKVKE